MIRWRNRKSLLYGNQSSELIHPLDAPGKVYFGGRRDRQGYSGGNRGSEPYLGRRTAKPLPVVDPRDGQPGHVAYLRGSRLPVWMIVELVDELGGDIEAAAKKIRKPAGLIRMALAYAEAYPDEIRDCLELSANMSFESMSEILPGRERL